MPIARTARMTLPAQRAIHSEWGHFAPQTQQQLIDENARVQQINYDQFAALNLLNSDPSPQPMETKPVAPTQYVYDRRETAYEKFAAMYPGDPIGAEAIWSCRYSHRITAIRITAIYLQKI